MVGIELAHGGDDRALRRPVDLGDEVALALAGHFQVGDPGVMAQNDVAGPARGADRDVDDGVHEMMATLKRCPFYSPAAPSSGADRG